jgi:putative ABC transport system substrate-binding protein
MKHSYRSLTILVLLLVIVVTSACGDDNDKKKEEEKTYSVGIRNIIAFLDPVVAGFKDGMAEKGYVEGENITYVYEGPDVLTTEQLIEANVDLIFSSTTIDALGAQELTDSIPIIFTLTGDPVGVGLVESIANPGGNITGVMTVLSDTKRLELYTQIVPGIKRVLVPSESNRPQSVAVLEMLRPAAEELGLELVIVDAPDEAAAAALQESLPEDLDAIFLLGSGGVNPAATPAWSVTAIENGLPLSTEYHLMTAEGVGPLMSYGTDMYAVGKQSAGMVDEILKGRNPGEIPVQAAELFLTVNLRTAEALGIEIADNILSKASVIERPADE